MTVREGILYVAMSLVAALSVESMPGSEGTVEGVVVDITDSRIPNATIRFADGMDESFSKTRFDGTYSIQLNPGTFTMTAGQSGFCTFRRAAFILQKHSSVRFNLQMWVCPTDTTTFIRYAELNEVPHTNLKPLILFANRDSQGDLQRFHGPKTDNDGTGHARKYPAVLTFNLLTVRAEEIDYNPSNHILAALGDVVWEDDSESGTGERVELKLDGFRPRPNR